MFKLFSRRKLAVHNQTIHVTLGDIAHLVRLHSFLAILIYGFRDPVAFHDTLWFAVAAQRIASVTISQCPCHIVTTEQHLAFLEYHAHLPECLTYNLGNIRLIGIVSRIGFLDNTVIKGLTLRLRFLEREYPVLKFLGIRALAVMDKAIHAIFVDVLDHLHTTVLTRDVSETVVVPDIAICVHRASRILIPQRLRDVDSAVPRMPELGHRLDSTEFPELDFRVNRVRLAVLAHCVYDRLNNRLYHWNCVLLLRTRDFNLDPLCVRLVGVPALKVPCDHHEVLLVHAAHRAIAELVAEIHDLSLRLLDRVVEVLACELAHVGYSPVGDAVMLDSSKLRVFHKIIHPLYF